MKKVRKLGGKTSRNSTTYYITIPSELVTKLKWKKGQKLVVGSDKTNKKIVISDWE